MRLLPIRGNWAGVAASLTKSPCENAEAVQSNTNKSDKTSFAFMGEVPSLVNLQQIEQMLQTG
jgi:hypothetical protein